MQGLQPFFTFYGGKWRSAPRYPAPKHPTIVEPFAGSAGYSIRYPDRRVVLVEKDPVIANLWSFLIRATPKRIRSLPLIAIDGSQSVQDLGLPPEEQSLIGFWLNKGTAAPCNRPSSWMKSGARPKSYWGAEIRERIASQVGFIRHWSVVCADYGDVNVAGEATWFVDPPYENAGRHYRHSSRELDFPHLGNWCKGLRGQVIVCEAKGASWLPFVPFMSAQGTIGRVRAGVSEEVVWIKP